MNQWLQLRYLRGPAYLVLLGIMFLLSEWHIIGFNRSWPLLLILAGVLSLAERAALTRVDPGQFAGGMPGTYPPYPPAAYPPQAYPPQAYPVPGYPPPAYTGTVAPPAPSTELATTEPGSLTVQHPSESDPSAQGRS